MNLDEIQAIEKQARLNALKQLLSGTDYKAIKHSEGIISDEDYAQTKAKRQSWRAEVNTLEEEIAADAGEEA
jgi:hypothetical protein